MLTLHVTNGDVAATGLARSGLTGDVLSWRDVLHDGPVPPDDDRAAFHRARAEFLASRGWTSVEEVIVDFETRDARLDEMGPAQGVTLWFEPDLYDQLQLIQILARLAARPPAARPAITIVPADLLLGPLPPDRFPALFAARRTIRDVDLQHGADAWRAFTAPDPAALMAMTERLDAEVSARTYGADEVVRLPFLAAALRRMLEEYPDQERGLSRSERQICETLVSGEMTLGKLYRTAHHSAESWSWLGDSGFAWYVQRLSDCPKPLLTHPNGTRVIAPGRDGKAFWERAAVLTPFGQDVLRERGDRIAANGVDRWIGGVALTPDNDWRWEARKGRVVKRDRHLP
jgi:hypothetical protein